MFGPKIKIDKDLYERLKKCAESGGYSSVDEYVIHILEKEVEHLHSDDAGREELKEKLKGLGYLS